MALMCLSLSLTSTSMASLVVSTSSSSLSSTSSSSSLRPLTGRRSLTLSPAITLRRTPITTRNFRRQRQVVCMAPEEEKMTCRSPLDFPIEWERPKLGRRPDIFPQFSPMKTLLPPPLPVDPPEEDEEEEEKKEEEEEDPEKEDPDKPDKPEKQ